MEVDTAGHIDPCRSLTYEEIIEKAWEDSRQLQDKRRRERDERRTAEAIAMGFSSKEELEEYEWEEIGRQEEEAEKRMAERAALECKTVEQLWSELCAGNKVFEVGSPLPSLSQCRCDDHPNPFFCPDTLVDYHSQELPEFMDLSAEQHRLRVEELQIEPDDASKRLTPEDLERAWDIASAQSIRTQLPPWARKNESVVSLLESSVPAGLDHREHDTPSLVSTSLGGDSASTELVLTPTDSGMDQDHDSVQAPQFGQGQAIKAPMHAKSPPMLRQQRKPRPSKKPSDKVSRILKRSPNPAKRTRSHKIIKFYELSQDGLPVISCKFPKVR